MWKKNKRKCLILRDFLKNSWFFFGIFVNSKDNFFEYFLCYICFLDCGFEYWINVFFFWVECIGTCNISWVLCTIWENRWWRRGIISEEKRQDASVALLYLSGRGVLPRTWEWAHQKHGELWWWYITLNLNLSSCSQTAGNKGREGIKEFASMLIIGFWSLRFGQLAFVVLIFCKCGVLISIMEWSSSLIWRETVLQCLPNWYLQFCAGYVLRSFWTAYKS